MGGRGRIYGQEDKMTLEETTQAIAECIKDAAENVKGFEQYRLVICSERVFINDYKPADDDYATRRAAADRYEQNNPADVPFRNTVFIVVKMGSGQRNMAVTNLPCTLEVMSEENYLDFARDVIMEYLAEYNFEFSHGVVASFMTPSVSDSAAGVYSGFRAIMSCSGSVKVADPGVSFVTQIWARGSSSWFRIPFISFTDSWSAQPDPMAMAGTGGRTMALNRQSTATQSIVTYLWHYGSEDFIALDEAIENADGKAKAKLQRMKTEWNELNAFSLAVLSTKVSGGTMNRKYRLYFKTNIPVYRKQEVTTMKGTSPDTETTSSVETALPLGSTLASGVSETALRLNGEDVKTVTRTLNDNDVWSLTEPVDGGTDSDMVRYMPVLNCTCILVSASLSQTWGDVSPWSLGFTEAKDSE